MSNKKLTFMVLDSETCSHFFADEIARGDSEAKKRISIGLPLIYDVAWCLVTRRGEILERKQFLVAETFSVPSVFNTAYYRSKRKIYIDKLARGETVIKPWNEIMKEFIEDMSKVNAVGAFNSMFDFKKAIPHTEEYIKHLYSYDFEQWEAGQRKRAERLAYDKKQRRETSDFEPNIFRFRGVEYPLFDLWGLAVNHLLNNATYKKECLKHELLTNSGTYFKSSAESTYQYLLNRYDFEEAHTALEDSEIEAFILSKIAQRHSISLGIEFFPFRNLGYTYDFVQRRKTPDRNEVETVYNAILNYCEGRENNSYVTQLRNKLNVLAELLG